MSSTNRKTRYADVSSDYYVTPPLAIWDFLTEFKKHEIFDSPILDPCAGGDNLHDMSYPFILKSFGYTDITTLDIREDSLAEIKTDYLTWNPTRCFKTIITNPPFNIARLIVERALMQVMGGGWVIMLLRLNFFGSKSRKYFWDKYPPKYAFVHSQRMSFKDGGGTDSIEYMHCVWQKGYNRGLTLLKVI
jgi:hypothetical protein